MSSILFPLVFNIFVFYIVRFNPPIEWPPSEQILWFGIFRLKDEFPNQKRSSQAMITFPLRVNMFCITVGLVFKLQLFQMSLAPLGDGLPGEETLWFEFLA